MTKEKELIKYAKALKEHCESKKCCRTCLFKTLYGFCGMAEEGSTPEEWEIPTLKLTITENEKVILQSIDLKYKYIARDKNGSLWLYDKKPSRERTGWGNRGLVCTSFKGFSDIFSFITWEDDEPYVIAELLEELEND